MKKNLVTGFFILRSDTFDTAFQVLRKQKGLMETQKSGLYRFFLSF